MVYIYWASSKSLCYSRMVLESSISCKAESKSKSEQTNINAQKTTLSQQQQKYQQQLF